MRVCVRFPTVVVVVVVSRLTRRRHRILGRWCDRSQMVVVEKLGNTRDEKRERYYYLSPYIFLSLSELQYKYRLDGMRTASLNPDSLGKQVLG